jgi:amino acid adenylation domain-containing protein/non-ribosomal peptide synthase protein (TIGR01720 family)
MSVQKEIVKGFRLSPQQRRLWSLHRTDDVGPYRALCSVLIEGELDQGVLEAVLEDVMSRHEILRTTFNRLLGLNLPVQVINEGRIDWQPELDLSGLSADEQFSLLDSQFEEAKRRAFNLAEGPLLQASLITLAPAKKVLILGLPAVCSDGTGLKNLVHEISCSCRAYLESGEVEAEQMQYADIAEYLTRLLEAEDTEPGREHWRRFNLLNLSEVSLPGQNQVSIDTAFEPAAFFLRVDPARAVQVKDTAQRYGVTPAVLLFACWQVLLWRLTDQHEFLIGAYFDGRKTDAFEGLPGLYGRYLPFHAQSYSRAKFTDILNQVDQLARQFDEWQDYFCLDQFFGPASGSSFFPICFEFEDVTTQYSINGRTFSIFKHYACIDRFNLKLSCVNHADLLSLGFHYDPGSFTQACVERVADGFNTLLASAIADPKSEIGELPILSEAVKHRLLVQFNETSVKYAKDKPIHQIVAEQAEKAPNNIAVVFHDRTLNYKELNARANQLAGCLRKMEVGPEVIVGIYIERSPEMVIAMLAVLKAGAAYLPIDADLPLERIVFMLDDANVPVLLTQRGLQQRLPKHKAEVICLDSDWDLIPGSNDSGPINTVSGENLAYVIYTSGSTGQPKAVMNTHQAILNFLLWTQEEYQLSESDAVLQKTPFSFDVSVWEFLWPLMVGARLVLAQPGGHKDSAYLVNLIRQRRITIVHFVPPMLQAFLEEEGVSGCDSLRDVMCGGEALPYEYQERFFARLDARLHNRYGPTEAAIDVTSWRCEKAGVRRVVPIGRPIANTQIYLLDELMQPVPIGVMGELYIGGEGLARGYLNRADLTAERFVPDQFSQRVGGRLYKTGDMARHLEDGNIEYIGRRDYQVKIRGHRIELGEVEAVLLQHGSVKESVVVAREEVDGHKRLVAYVVAVEKATVEASELGRYVREKLPEYMVPSAIVKMEKLPLSPNGKADRRALPDPDVVRPADGKEYVAPRTEVEEKLSEVWKQVLKLKQVGMHDNFFELGGDSILSIQMVNRLNKEGLRFAPRHIFQYPTIAELATVTETSITVETERGIVTGLVPLTPIQRRFFENDIADRHHWNQASMFELRQPLDTAIVEQVIHYLVVQHDALRHCFKEGNSGWQQMVTEPKEIKRVFEVDFSTIPDDSLESTIEGFASELQASLNLAEGSLFKVGVIHLGERRSALLLLIIHHLVVDIVSWGILLEDLQSAYQQLSRGEAVHLPAKTTSFKRWAERLKEYANSQPLRQELHYWLAGSRPRIPKIPVDFPGGINTESSARTIWGALTVKETTALLKEVPKAYRTMINDVLLAALVQAFSEWTNSRSLLVDLENHGREEISEDIHLSRTIGWFTCIFPLLLELGEDETPSGTLKSVKEQIRRVPKGGIGYGLLRYLSEDKEAAEQLKALPQADVCFNYVGRDGSATSESALFGPVHNAIGLSRSPKALRTYLIEINGHISQGQLFTAWTYSENLHLPATITNIAEGYNRALRAIIDHCSASDAGGHTPSDFSLSGLNQRQLDNLIAELSKLEG